MSLPEPAGTHLKVRPTREALAAWSAELEGHSAEDILRWAADRFAPRLTFATGFGMEGCVIIDLIARASLPVDLFTLDTGLLFPESYDLRSLNIVQSETEHLERLVSDLLDLSRVQWGELDLQYTSFYLADVLTERVRLAQVSAEQHAIYLDIQTQDSRIIADQLRVGQVFGNILDNAIKFSPPGKQVTVKLQEQDDEYLISVMDQGIGVNPESFDHIFERFYRIRNIASRQYSGIGMGLFVAKAIVEAHGGRINFSSNQGGGSTFYFTLPRVPRTSKLVM